MNDKMFVRITDIAPMLSVSRSTVYKWIEDKILPEPFEIAPRVKGYIIKDLQEWLEKRKQQYLSKSKYNNCNNQEG